MMLKSYSYRDVVQMRNEYVPKSVATPAHTVLKINESSQKEDHELEIENLRKKLAENERFVEMRAPHHLKVRQFVATFGTKHCLQSG